MQRAPIGALFISSCLIINGLLLLRPAGLESDRRWHLVVIGFATQFGKPGMVARPALLKINLDGLASCESGGAGILQPVVIGKVGQLGPQVLPTKLCSFAS